MKNLPQTIHYSPYFIILLCYIFIYNSGCNSAPKPVMETKGDLTGFELTEIPGTTAKTAIRKDPSGQVVIEGFLDGDKKTGTWLEHNNEGDISTLTSYLNGFQEGPALKFSFRGQVDQRTNFHLGQLDGPWVQYKFGKVMETRQYKNGKLDGTVKIFDEKSYKLRQETEYKDGKQDGHFRYYDDNGNMTMEYEYKNGEKVSGGMVEKK
ncbi:MAG: hypothetical protein WBP41_09590 [Saprospiraceae bacterium]